MAYFEGAGGQTLGRHGHSKDHRPDLAQIIVAVLVDGDGRPVCSEMWPGNGADAPTLIPVNDRRRQPAEQLGDREVRRDRQQRPRALGVPRQLGALAAADALGLHRAVLALPVSWRPAWNQAAVAGFTAS